MGKYVRYKRFVKEFENENKIQEFFNELSSFGWEIIYYNETPKTLTILSVVVVCGKLNDEI